MRKVLSSILCAFCFVTAQAQTQVASIAELKALDSGTQATLTFSKAKVLFVYTSGASSQAFIRDNTGAIEIVNSGISLSTNDDISGTVTGTFSVVDNTPELTVVTANTISASAGDVAKPVKLTDYSLSSNYQCDLVELINGTYDNSGDGSIYDSKFNSVFFEDAFNTNFSKPSGGKVSVTGIAITKKNDQGGDQYFIYPTDAKSSISYYFSQDITNTVPNGVEGGSVHMDRSPLYSSHWNTFCVPFDMTAEQVKKYFGEGTLITEFSNVEGTTMIFEAPEDGSISSGTPYLIKPAHDVTEFNFEGVDIYGSADGVQKDGYYFYGTFDPYDFADNDVVDKSALFLGAGNKLYYATDDDHVMPGMRAFFWLPSDVKTEAKISFGGITDGIECISKDVEISDAPVYNISGQKVGYSLKDLPKGIYIQNGQKFIK